MIPTDVYIYTVPKPSIMDTIKAYTVFFNMVKLVEAIHKNYMFSNATYSFSVKSHISNILIFQPEFYNITQVMSVVIEWQSYDPLHVHAGMRRLVGMAGHASTSR